jgi:hypothetical protein
MKRLLAVLLLILPWRLRRIILITFFGQMDASSRIGSLTMCKRISFLKMNEKSSIGTLNWVTVFPEGRSHSIDLHECRQSSKPFAIGEYCFVGTGCVILAGSELPDYSVLGASSLLNRSIRISLPVCGQSGSRYQAIAKGTNVL